MKLKQKTEIGDKAFCDCKSLKSVTIPDLVTKICSGAFSCCDSLKSTTLLNPDCKIAYDPDTISNGYDGFADVYYNGVIRGYENSTAQAYAEKFGYKFERSGDYSDPTIT